MNSEQVTILVIDDDPSILGLIKYILGPGGYEIITAGDGRSGLLLLKTCSPSLVILDIQLPDTNGFDLCREIRKYSQVPVIMEVPKNDAKTDIAALNAGIDYCIPDPLSPNLLAARVRALLRRQR
jgi:DNA-binding response OmpR family regulator